MRPISLKMEGFASFRRLVEIDFTSLDLFAICGVTGAGKTTIIDGMTFALYGATPRLGERRSGELINQSCRKARILFEFSVARGVFRIVRTIQRHPSSLVTRRHLEQKINGEWQSLASSERQVRQRVKDIIGLDFAGFNRSIVLPQGQFDQFLKGSAAERRKILSDLLQLDVYERMGRLARQRSRELAAAIEILDQQLEAPRSDPEEVARCGSRIRELERRTRKIRGRHDQLSAAERLLRQTARDRERRSTLLARQQRLHSGCDQLEAGLAEAAANLARLKELRKRHREEAKNLHYDEELRLKLLALLPRAERKHELVEEKQRLEARLVKVRKDSESSIIPARKLKERIDALEDQLEKTVRGTRCAKEELAGLKKRLGSPAQLSKRLLERQMRLAIRAGDTCPVCAQPVARPPRSLEAGGDDGGLDAVSLEEHTSRMEVLGLRIQKGAERQSRLQQDLSRQEKSGRDLTLERELLKQAEVTCSEQLSQVRAELAALESTLGKWSDPEPLKVTLQQQDDGRRQFLHLDEKIRAVEASLVTARQERQALKSRLQEIRRELAACREDLGRVETTLGETLNEVDRILAHFEIPAGSDAESLVEVERERLTRLASEASAELGRCQEKLATAKRRQEEIRRLTVQREESETQRQLFQQLSLDLRASELVSFIQEEALGRLADDASVHFHRLSGGRYRFTLSAGEFCVLDFWNAEEVRPAATLSGGESFLASLSLALALSESLAEYCSRSRHLHLDSLFLDEGISTLDPETLDLVVQGIENLAADRRMIGIVSHLPELAGRLPGRIRVSKSVEGSTVTVS